MHTNLCSLVQQIFMHFTTFVVLLLLLCCSRIHFMGLLTRKKIEPTNTATSASHRVNMAYIFIPMDFAPTANEQMREIRNADFTSLSDDFLWTWICCFFYLYIFCVYSQFIAISELLLFVSNNARKCYKHECSNDAGGKKKSFNLFLFVKHCQCHMGIHWIKQIGWLLCK